MVAKCTYFLNDRQISMLTCDGKAYAAFSGDKGHENKASDVGLKDLGPIPKGTYYIIDRQSGGRMGWLWDPVKDMYSRSKHAEWFALHPAQRPNDDWIIVDGVKRTSLRLHPIGSPVEAKDASRWYRLPSFSDCASTSSPSRRATSRARSFDTTERWR
jgi:hypothetical protein